MKLEKALVIERAGAEKRVIDEIKIEPRMITAKVILDAENQLLLSGRVFPAHDMTTGKAFQLFVLAEILDLRTEELEQMSGKDFMKLSGQIAGFFNGSVLESLQAMLLEK